MTTSSSASYTTEALVRAISPVKTVIDSFVNDIERQSSNTSSRRQGKFVSLLLSVAGVKSSGNTSNEVVSTVDWASIHLMPSWRYVHKLVHQYTSYLDGCNIELEDDNLASLVCYFSMTRCASFPDPASSCVATFKVPRRRLSNNDEHECIDDSIPIPQSASIKTDTLRIRTYPYHNDVGVAKVWEAGACLAEYIMYNPQLVCDRNVVELGAGVGLTGLVAAGVAQAKTVHMTDYTEACMDNLAYNVCDNRDWLVRRDINPDTVTVGKLEWGDCSKGQQYTPSLSVGYPWADSINALSTADVLLAADVIYDHDPIPALVATTSIFLSGQKEVQSNDSDGGHERVAIFATPFRNKDTFALFERELEEKGIVCTFDQSSDKWPNVFPCYVNQPRTDVRVCTMRMKT